MTVPVPLDQLVAAGHDLAERLGRLPTGRELRRHLRIGHPRSAEVLAAIAPGPVAEPVFSDVRCDIAEHPEPQVEPAAEPEATAVPGDANDSPAAPVRRSTRLLVWAALLAGIAASLAANIAHAQSGTGPRLASAWAPLALLLAVSVAERAPRPDRRWHAGLQYAGIAVVATVAAVVSYGHQYTLLLSYGETTLSAALLPLSVDGLVVVASMALIAIARHTST